MRGPNPRYDAKLVCDVSRGCFLRRLTAPPVPVSVAPWLWIPVTCADPDGRRDVREVLARPGVVSIEPRWREGTPQAERRADHWLKRYFTVGTPIIPASPADRVLSLAGALSS